MEGEVKDHLLKLYPVGKYLRQVWNKIERNRNGASRQLKADELDDLLNRLVQGPECGAPGLEEKQCGAPSERKRELAILGVRPSGSTPAIRPQERGTTDH
jgi:hypothetical protein